MNMTLRTWGITFRGIRSWRYGRECSDIRIGWNHSVSWAEGRMFSSSWSAEKRASTISGYVYFMYWSMSRQWR